MPNNVTIWGGLSALNSVELAVPRADALQAAHVLKREPPLAGEAEEPRSPGLDQRLVAVVVIIALLLLGGFVIVLGQLPRG